MRTRRSNPYRVKQHHSYNVPELATALCVHKNTIRNWQRQGLEPIDNGRPILFHGSTVREFLLKRNANRKRPCPPGTLYCLRCRQPHKPAGGMVDYVPVSNSSGSLRALCDHCDSMMRRHARKSDLAAIMPDCTVQILGNLSD